jgi:hypothetical protein
MKTLDDVLRGFVAAQMMPAGSERGKPGRAKERGKAE